MKFVCQNCKAKYQIADEKVAGRSVKMKCRQCGTLIPITGADGTAVAQSTPGSVPPAAKPSAPATVGAPAAAKPSAPKQSAPQASGAVTSAAVSTGAAPARAAAPAPAATKSSPTAASKSSPTAAKPAPTPAAPPVAKSSPAASVTPRPAPAPARSAPSSAAAPPPRARPAPATTRAVASASAAAVHVGAPEAASAPETASGPQPIDESFDDEMTRVADSGALAGAFAAAVAAPSPRGAAPAQSGRDSVPAGADEWFVGINGVPVGPLRLSELRSRAQSGAIGTDSLVWRDGFEEWLPLHKFPELVAIVEDGMSAARASAAPLPVPREHADPFAPSPGERALRQPESGPVQVARPAVAAPTPTPTPVVDEPLVPPRRSGMNIAAVFAMVVAVVLGLALGFVIFSKEKTTIVEKIVEVPAKLDDAAPAPPPSSAPEAASSAEPTRVAKGTGNGSKGSAKADAPAQQQGLQGLSGLKGLASGPQGGPSGAAVSSGGGQPLDSSQVQATVGRYTGSVKRSCWQPALDTRDKDAPTSARVTVAITVGPDGGVRSATTSGDPRGYSGLASCISKRVQSWSFPPSSGTTTVNVPFVFAAQ